MKIARSPLEGAIMVCSRWFGEIRRKSGEVGPTVAICYFKNVALVAESFALVNLLRLVLMSLSLEGTLLLSLQQ